MTLDSAGEALEGGLGNPFAIGFDAGGCFGAGLDCWVVCGKRNFEAVERVDVYVKVGVGITNEAGEAVFAARDID